jgi:hypothetical protein
MQNDLFITLTHLALLSGLDSNSESLELIIPSGKRENVSVNLKK